MNTATTPVTWVNGTTTVVAHFPAVDGHAAYAGTAHAATVAQLAAAPAVAPALSGSSVDGLGGATLVGLGLLVWTIARWKHSTREHHHGFFKGLAIAILLGSFGIFSMLSQTVTSTGNSTGSVITSNVGANNNP
jgi:hypothetical protein